MLRLTLVEELEAIREAEPWTNRFIHTTLKGEAKQEW